MSPGSRRHEDIHAWFGVADQASVRRIGPGQEANDLPKPGDTTAAEIPDERAPPRQAISAKPVMTVGWFRAKEFALSRGAPA